MKAYVYLHAEFSHRDDLVDKIIELGYTAKSCIRGDAYVVYQVEMDLEDLVILKLCIPSLEVDIRENE